MPLSNSECASARISFFSLFLQPATPAAYMEFPRLRVKSELQLRPMPQPQQHQIQAASVNYTTACSNTRSLTHWARRAGIEPKSSRGDCVRSLTCWAAVGMLVPWSWNFQPLELWEVISFLSFSFLFLSFSLFFFKWSHLWHIEVSRSGIESNPQLQQPAGSFKSLPQAEDQTHTSTVTSEWVTVEVCVCEVKNPLWILNLTMG